MSTDKKLSALVESQFPEFALEEGPKLVSFIKAYYEWMEQTGQALYESKAFPDNQDIDTAEERFLDYFKREIFNSIPDDIRANKRLLAKHVRELYRAKGSEQSYRFLFRALFDEEIDVYYPGDYILKTSDGRWKVDRTIRITSLANSNTDLFDGKIVTGQTSGAVARVNGISSTEEFGITITELFLKNIVGSFEDGERVVNEDNTNSGILFNDTGVLQELIVTQGGQGHRAGDAVNFLASSGSGANGVVTGTTDQSAITFTITDGGSGYTTNASISVIGVGRNATFRIDTISNTEVVSLGQDTIGPVKNVVLNTGPTFSSGGSNTATLTANLASANISTPLNAALLFANVTVGTINSISVLNNGFGYSSLPTVVVTEEEVAVQEFSDGAGGFKGQNAIITTSHIPGAITRVEVNQAGVSYSKFEPVTIQNTVRDATNAIASPIISGQVTYPGKYTDTKGFISWDQRLQDGDFYQEYSYVIRSTQSIKDYKEITKKLIHPAGTKQFGEYKIVADITSPLGTISDSTTISVETTGEISIPEIISSVESQYAPEGIAAVYEIEEEVILSPTLSTVESEVLQYTPGTGTISVSNVSSINAYASAIINTYASAPIGSLGSPNYFNGNNTIFTVELSNNQQFLVVDQNGSTANGIYFVETIFSNTVLSTTFDYASNTLTNGIFYYANTV